MLETLAARIRPFRRYAEEFSYVLGPPGMRLLLPLVAGFIFLSLLDLVGLSLIGPFIALATNPKDISIVEDLKVASASIGLTGDFQLIATLGVAIIVLFFAKSVSGFYVNRAIMRFSLGHQKRIKLTLLESYFSLPLEKAITKNSASLMTTVNQHALIFTNRVMIPGLKAASELVFMVCLFAFLLLENLVVTLSLAVLFLALAMVYDLIVKGRIKRSGRDTLDSGQLTVKLIGQAADGFKEIKVAGAEDFFLSKLGRYSDLYAEANTYAQSLQVIPRYLVEVSVITFVVTLLLIGLVVYGGSSPELISSVGIFAFAAIRSMSSVNKLLSSGNHLRFGRAALKDLVQDLRETETTIKAVTSQPSKVHDESSAFELFPFRERVCAKGITYTYPNKSAPVLSDVDLCIKCGESIGIIGVSGSGKTTLIDVLLGLLHPQKGEVTVDGVPIASNIRGWMNNIAYIPQSVFLLDDTIAANIALGVAKEDLDSERLWEAIEIAQLRDMVTNLPMKEETVVGERGSRISGGQRQRIAVARALYHRRDLLVMDEATAALDSGTENEVVEAIKALRGKVTMVVIAHRLSTLRYCNRILRLDSGQIVQEGSYDEIVGVVS